MKYIDFEDMPVYRKSASFADAVWDIVGSWEWFSKRTLGIQFVNSSDSIPANMADIKVTKHNLER